MATTAQKSDHVTEVMKKATAFMDAVKALDALRRDWNALNLATELTDADCQGHTVADIAAVYTSHSAVNDLLINGFHESNFAKVRKGYNNQ